MSVSNILGSDGKILPFYLPAGGGGGSVTNPLSENLDCGNYELTNASYVRTNVVELETLEAKAPQTFVECVDDLQMATGKKITTELLRLGNSSITWNGVFNELSLRPGTSGTGGSVQIFQAGGARPKLNFYDATANEFGNITLSSGPMFTSSAPLDIPYINYTQQQGYPYPLYGTGNINPGLPINNGGFVGNLISIAPFQIFTNDFRKDLSPTGLYAINLQLYIYSTVNDVFEIGATSADVTTGFVEYPGQITTATGSWCAALPGAVGGGNYRHTVCLQDYYDLNALPEDALWLPLIIIKTTTVAGPVSLIGGRFSLSITPVK